MAQTESAELRKGAGEVFRVFLRLGLESFGGPIAHLGYFREDLVARRRWVSDRAYADLVALCQFLPGPTSSQVGFALGWSRAGAWGAVAAFLGFTLPSALLMIGVALTATALDGPLGEGLMHGLKIVAVAIVAQAVLGMARSLCPDRERAAIAAGAVALLAILPGAFGMIGAILFGGCAGLALGRGTESSAEAPLNLGISRRMGAICLAAFAGLLIGLPLLAGVGSGFAVADKFYRAGALVFGGGHVVLPLLEAELVAPGWVSPSEFLAGYGAAQAMPGPLFAFASYLGALLEPGPNGLVGAALALIMIFLPGFLILLGALPFWEALRSRAWAQSLMQGANAAVVGILGAALYDPVFTSAVTEMRSFALALIGFVLLTAWRLAPWIVVILGALSGVGLHLLD